MKFLVGFLIVAATAFIQAQIDQTVFDNKNAPIPKYVMETLYAALRAQQSPHVSPELVEAQIRNPPENVANALAIYDPSFGPKYKSIAGFDIPLHKEIYVKKLKNALETGRLENAFISSTVFESISIPPSGPVKDFVLRVYRKLLNNVAQSGLVPGIEQRIPIILKNIEENNEMSGMIQGATNIVGNVPFVGNKIIRLVGAAYARRVLRLYADSGPSAVAILYGGIPDGLFKHFKLSPYQQMWFMFSWSLHGSI